MYKLKRSQDMNVVLDARWLPGVWLGRTWGSISHRVAASDRQVVEVRAVHRRLGCRAVAGPTTIRPCLQYCLVLSSELHIALLFCQHLKFLSQEIVELSEEVVCKR